MTRLRPRGDLRALHRPQTIGHRQLSVADMPLILPSRASSIGKPSSNAKYGALPAACLAIAAWFGGSPLPAASQVAGETEMPERLAVFLDCGYCNETFIRQDMTYIDWVRDREVADVHVLVTEGGHGRQLTVAYRVGAFHITYQDTTIYEEIAQLLPAHTLTTGYEVTQLWGEVDVGVNASQYLHELKRYSVRFNGSVDLRITQGLSIERGGNVAFIHDQLNLPKGDADLEEVLLRRRQLETNYQPGSTSDSAIASARSSTTVTTRFGGRGSQDRF